MTEDFGEGFVIIHLFGKTGGKSVAKRVEADRRKIAGGQMGVENIGERAGFDIPAGAGGKIAGSISAETLQN